MMVLTNLTWTSAARTSLVARDGETGNQVYIDKSDRIRWPMVAAAVDAGQVGDPVLSKYDLKAYAAATRWRKETGGCDWKTHRVQTDRESRSELFAELTAATSGIRIDGSSWKFASGFAAVMNAEMSALCLAIKTHVDACFAKEQSVITQIDAGTITTKAAIDTAFG